MVTPLKRKNKKTADLRQNPVMTLTALMLLGIGTGLVSLLVGASIFGIPMFYSYFSSPLVVFLNILPPVLLTLFMYWASGRAWLGFIVPALILFVLAAVSFFKMQIRNEPLVFSDFRLAGEAGGVMAGYDLAMNWKIWAAAGYAALGATAAFLLLRHKPRAGTRLIGTASVIVACALLYGFVYTNDQVYASAKGSYDISQWSGAEKYIVRGFVYPYIHSIPDTSSQLPTGFEKDSASEILSAYGDDAIDDDKKVNIVSVMLEAYADFSVFDAIDFNVDVYGPLHQLEKESVSGSLVVNTFAGGTIDSERSFLTGFTQLGDFTTPENSYVRYLKDQGYYTEGFHSGDSWYYDRKTVNMNLGFDRYYYLEDFQNSNRWDEFFFSTVIKQYESRDPSVPYFSYNLSYQNHGPYDSAATSETAYIKKGGLSDESYNILNNYLEGVSDTTQRVGDLIGYFRNRREPVVVVLFGDHKPWLGNSNEVYRELGIDTDLSGADGFYAFYTTPYIIWANDAAKAALGGDFTGDGGEISPCFLMNRLFEECAWGGSAYMKAADELRQYVPVVSSATGFFEENSTLTPELSDEAGAVYECFRYVEYYWMNNFAD
jgi:phosphoglycerol transferase MdoB-like AlkP superfamily enzyme